MESVNFPSWPHDSSCQCPGGYPPCSYCVEEPLCSRCDNRGRDVGEKGWTEINGDLFCQACSKENRLLFNEVKWINSLCLPLKYNTSAEMTGGFLRIAVKRYDTLSNRRYSRSMLLEPNKLSMNIRKDLLLDTINNLHKNIDAYLREKLYEPNRS
jgi:hypothetical protein